jgi:glycosyltransferase involved in cell wall biosynthesis
MRIAAYGMISDTGGSSAGAFTGLLRTLLEQGHEVTFYGVRGYTDPKSLEGFAGYRFHSVVLDWSRRYRPYIERLPTRYPMAIRSVIANISFQKEAIRLIETSDTPFDFVLCLDIPNLWRSKIPVLSWPQAPPQTEWSALRKPHIARAMIRGEGLLYYSAVQAFYASRWLQGKVALGASDLVLTGSPWARDQWIRFGLAPERVELMPYPIDLAALAELPPPDTSAGVCTFLWLGRSTPRKRIDLFLGAFERLCRRRPEVRAKLVGRFDMDPSAMLELARFRTDPRVTISDPIERARVPSLFAETHVLVQPSESENFGFSIAEALGAGRPVVAGPTNGTAAFGDDALYGFERYDVESVADAMERAWNAVRADPTRVASAARSAARRHFTPTLVAERVCESARGAIARRAARGKR